MTKLAISFKGGFSMLTVKEFRTIILLVFAVPAALQAFVKPSLEKYFISNADISLISACSSMGELLVIVVSAAFCTKKAGEWFDKIFYLFLFVSDIIQISIAAAGPEKIVYRFYANTLNEYLVLAITGRVLNLLYNRLMSGVTLFKFCQALTVSIGASKFFGYTMVTIIPNFSIEISLWIFAIVDVICSLIEAFLFQQAHKMIAAGLKEGDE